ncbi:MAG: NAD(P)/FAD-dependent oxidoreductase [Acidobacteriota bacterium]
MPDDVIVIGGGAAGLFCAIEAGRRGRRATVLEHNAEVGRKIVISGGGRCNFTNIHTRPENFISQNPHFARSALAGYTPQDFVGLVRSHQIDFYEKKLGQLFCRESSRSIVEMLLTECRRSRVKIRTGCQIRSVEYNSKFIVETNTGRLESDSLVIAAGGLSFAKIGATRFGYDIAEQFGLKVTATRPSLVPMVIGGLNMFSGLAGISADSVVETDGQNFRENILVTHRGLSGPAILQISNYWQPGKPIAIDLLPDEDLFLLLEENRQSRRRVDNFLGGLLPARLAEHLTADGFKDRRLNQLNNAEIEMLGQRIKELRLQFSGTEGYDRAEVTLGGVSTDELSSKTMEAKNVSGIFFIGEVVDVTGWLGGHNFQWAWSSAFAAAKAL